MDVTQKTQDALSAVQPALNNFKNGIDVKCLIHSAACTVVGLIGYHFLFVSSKLTKAIDGISKLEKSMTSQESAAVTFTTQLKEIKDILVSKGIATATKAERDYALEKARSTMRSALAFNQAQQSNPVVYEHAVQESNPFSASNGFTAVMKGE